MAMGNEALSETNETTRDDIGIEMTNENLHVEKIKMENILEMLI